MARYLSALLSLAAIHLSLSAPLAGQQWNTPDVRALVLRGVERRTAAQADSALQSYRARAHGFVFFLAQVGEGLAEPPRLVKADELVVEVYWRAPGLSKQVIRGWRDGAFLPYGITYHRDHLGIVTNNFGPIIRIGEGDEVRDVIHPLSPAGLDTYDFALVDSLAIRTGSGSVKVYEVATRPRSFQRPLVVGTLFLDAESAELVRFRFSFTPAAYLDNDLEDISVVLENSRWDGRFWLPYRQEVEIRRRSTWLDFPARGIIRGRWEIEDYEFNVELPEEIFRGPAIAGLQSPVPSDSIWDEPLADAIAGVAAPINEQDMSALRVEVERIAGTRALAGLPARRIAAGSVSDLLHVNRVQGLTLGVGGAIALRGSRIQLRPSLGYGTADDRVTGGVALEASTGATRFTLFGSRRVRDFSDLPVIAPLVNSVLAQEAGKDYGDYVLLLGAGAAVRHHATGRTAIAGELMVEESSSLGVAAAPANGTYRPNPALGAGTYRIARLRLERASGGVAIRRDLQGALSLEAGEGPTEYVRGTIEGRWLTSLGGADLLSRVYAGWGSEGLPAYRSFVLGGRGTLVGEPFRGYGGRRAALVQVEWRFDVPAPAIPLGSFASTGRRMTVAPFVAAGWADRTPSGLPWQRSDGVRPVVGVAAEWLMRLIRVEAGVALRGGGFGVTVDLSRDWWGIL